MEYIEAGDSAEIKQGTGKPYRIGEHDIVIFNLAGEFYALRRWCTHMGGDLSEGEIEGKTVTCPRHGSQFDITTGKNSRGPKMGPFHLSTGDEMTYPVKIQKDKIMVGIQDVKMMP